MELKICDSHITCKADANPSLDVRGIFLDLLKAFDRVWRDGLMYTLKSLGICGNYYGLLHSFLSDRHRKGALNIQSSNWSHIKTRVPQGSINLYTNIYINNFSLVYINNFLEDLTTSAKLFADVISLFSLAHSAASSASLNDYLLKICRWAYQWKIIFNPGASKQAQEIVFSYKANASNHETFYFNNVPVIRENIQKHLGLCLESKLNFFDHINEKI